MPLDTSTTDTEDQAEVTESPPVVEAEESESSMSDAIFKAFGDDDEDEATPAGGYDADDADDAKANPPSEADGPSEGEAEAKPASDDDKLPFHKHPRWQEVIAQKREAETAIEAQKAEIETLQVGHSVYQKMTDFCKQSGIDNDHVNDLFTAGALLNKDPAAFLDFVKPWIDQAEQASGRRLDADLTEAIDNGEIAESRALELHKARVEAKASKDAMEAAKLQSASERQSAADRSVGVLVESVAKWEAGKKSSDPDFEHISDRVTDGLRNWFASGLKSLPSEQEVRQKLDDLVAKEKAFIAKFRPKPSSINPPLASRGAGRPNLSEPKTTAEAIMNAFD